MKKNLATIAAFGFVASIVGLFFVYVIAVISYPLVIVWAIYKIVTHFF
jgi:hypothetical protein